MFSPIEGIFLILAFVAIFGGLAYGISWYSTREFSFTKAQFLLADRKLGFWEASFSIAATWIWVPALFVSAQKAFTNGWIGLFWFLVPNVLCLLFFAFFAVKMKKEYPSGFTISEYMEKLYSPRVQKMYWFTLTGLTVCAFAVQLLAGGKLIASLTGIPYFYSTLILAAVPLVYSLAFGLKASIITDFVKMIMILMLGTVIIPLVLFAWPGAVSDGLGGVKGNYLDFFTQDSLTLFLTFGLPTTIGLISGPFGDQSFWQRTFATEEKSVGKAFTAAAFIFGIVPLMMGMLGFVAAGAHLTVKDPQMVNFETVVAATGTFGAIAMFLLIMSGLTSIIDSKLCSISSIAGHDVAEKYGLDFMKSSRFGMLILTAVAILIANIPDLKIVHLFLFYGTIRSATLIPTIFTLLGKTLNEAKVFYGVLAAICVGLPIFGYGNFNSLPPWIVAGSLLTVLLPLAFNFKEIVSDD